MDKTERIYYTDCYMRAFDARVCKVEPDPGGFRVFLDRTAFYPESGGQPMDLGTLGGMRVLAVTEEGESIAHLLERAPVAQTVHGEIDWTRRLDHMQQHTGQHILSAALVKIGGYQTVGFHVGEKVSSIDLDSDRLGHREIEEVEELANAVVFENRPVRIFFCSAAEGGRLELRKPTFREGDIRLVEVEDFDRSACGGTHVDRTGSVGLIIVRKIERMRGSSRLEFLCGRRALRAARQDFALLGTAAGMFSTSGENVPAMIAKHADELRAIRRERENLIEQLADYEARELWRGAPEKDGWRIIRHIFPAEESVKAKIVAHAVAKQASSVAFIGVRGRPARLYFAQSAAGPFDMATLLKEAASQFGGKGGGTRNFAQGGGLDEARLEEALALAESLLAG